MVTVVMMMILTILFARSQLRAGKDVGESSASAALVSRCYRMAFTTREVSGPLQRVCGWTQSMRALCCLPPVQRAIWSSLAPLIF